MNISRSRFLRWLQVVLTLFLGQMIANGIYEYIIPGICGLLSRIRPTYDSILLILIGLLMLGYVVYTVIALWYCRRKMLVVSVLILICILALTVVKSIMEILYMGRNPMRAEWLSRRIVEFSLRVFGILAGILFIVRLKQGYRPEDL